MTDAFTPTAIHIIQGEPLARASHEDALSVLHSPALRAIIAERISQIEQHGHDLQHDSLHDSAELASAAYSYIAAYLDICHDPESVVSGAPDSWPWAELDWKEPAHNELGKRKALLKAIALLWAEVDRVDAAMDLISAARPLTLSSMEN